MRSTCPRQHIDVVNKLGAIVPSRKTLRMKFGFVLVNPSGKGGGNAHIQHGMPFISHNIYRPSSFHYYKETKKAASLRGREQPCGWPDEAIQ
jgi:hypothetical protein